MHIAEKLISGPRKVSLSVEEERQIWLNVHDKRPAIFKLTCGSMLFPTSRMEMYFESIGKIFSFVAEDFPNETEFYIIVFGHAIHFRPASGGEKKTKRTPSPYDNMKKKMYAC